MSFQLIKLIISLTHTEDYRATKLNNSDHRIDMTRPDPPSRGALSSVAVLTVGVVCPCRDKVTWPARSARSVSVQVGSVRGHYSQSVTGPRDSYTETDSGSCQPPTYAETEYMYT